MATLTPRRKQQLFLALRLLATLVLIGLVLKAVPLQEVWGAMRTLSPVWVAWALGAELAMRVVSILRWHLLLPPAGVRVPFTETLRLGFIALFYNNFMPSTVGGDVAKSVLAIRSGGSAAPVVASVLVDRAVVGWGSLVVFGLIVGAFVDFPPFKVTMLVLLGGGLLAGVAVVLLARRNAAPVGALPTGLVARLARKVMDKLSEISSALLQYRHHRGALAASWLVSCVGIVLVGLSVQYWCAALGHPLPLLRMIAVAVILKISGIVPVSIGNVGWTEGATLLLLQWGGIPTSAALAVGVLQRVAGIALSLIGAACQLGSPVGGAAATPETDESDMP